ncbi:MAG: ATP-binding protein [Sphingomicrobium sp.]
MADVTLLARALLNSSDEPSLVVDRGRVVAINRAAERIWPGAEGNDVRFAIRHPDALELILAPAATAGQRELVGIDGTDRPWRVVVAPLSGTLKLVRLTDMSAMRSAERMRTDFVANASHELRTPLATVIGYAETLAEDGELDAGLRQRFGATIRSEAGRMLRLIEDLMALSRIEADRFRAPGEQVDLGIIVDLAIGDCGELSHRSGAAIAFDRPAAPALVRGDARQLEVVVTNLIANALRYGCDKPGGTIDVSIETAPSGATLYIQDHGDGVDPLLLPRLTERFFRVDAARSRDSGGTGLGLAIVKHIVERHRGTLDIRATPGGGMTVVVTLPAG